MEFVRPVWLLICAFDSRRSLTAGLINSSRSTVPRVKNRSKVQSGATRTFGDSRKFMEVGR